MKVSEKVVVTKPILQRFDMALKFGIFFLFLVGEEGRKDWRGLGWVGLEKAVEWFLYLLINENYKSIRHYKRGNSVGLIFG